MATITSLQNPRVKNAVKLRSSRQRRKQGRILIEGRREIARAVAAGVRLEEAFVCPELCAGDVAALLEGSGASVLFVTEAVFARLAFGARAEGVLAVAATPQRTLADLVLADAPLVAVLEGVEKPGNVGAVLRSADGAGVSAVIIADGGTDLYNPGAIRASLGTIFSLPVATATTAETIAWLQGRAFKIHAARVDAVISHTQADLTGPVAIVLGSEAAGLSPAWSADFVTGIALPQRGAADSLNVSAAAAVLFYEALRQRMT